VGKDRRTDEFVEQLEPIRHMLYGYARRAAYRPEMAADMVQEAALIAWRQYDRFERGTNFRAWVFKIMVNTVFSFNKRVGRERLIESSETLDAMMVIEHEDAWQAILEDPQRLLENLDERLVWALDALSPDERQCLLLRLMEGFTYREIADMLSIPMGTVMSHAYRARMRLRERLADMALELGIVPETQR
jgi:RNA polymerase sigma-70 factor (ECF subfamily)